MSAADELDNLQEKVNWHWRNSMRIIRFFAFDARAAFVIIILFFRLADPSAWLLVFMVFMAFRLLEKKGLTVPAAMRNLRSWLIGKKRPGWIGVKKKVFIDYG